MTEQINTDTNPTENIENDNKGYEISYLHMGKVTAKNSNSNPNVIEAALANVYQRFLNDQKLDEQGIKDRISRLKAEVLQKKNQIDQLKGDLNSSEHLKEKQENRIEELEIDKIKAKDSEIPSSEYIPYIIGIFITVLLTLYLIVFYSSTGYSAFYGVKSGSIGFINPNVFMDAKNKGGGVTALIILFPIIFIGLGFLIHDSLERKKYLMISLLLFFTLLVDSMIGYKITQAIYNNDFEAGKVNDPWKLNMIYYDVNFYIILSMGFVVYVIWGVLLNYVLNKSKELQPDKAMELRIENLNKKINDCRENLTEIVLKINTTRAQISTLDNQISDQEKEIIGYEGNVIPVSIPLLKSVVGEFMTGWFSFTTMMSPNNHLKKNEEASRVQQFWIDRKIQELKEN